MGIADTAMYGRRLWYCRMYVHLWLLCTSLRKVVLPGAGVWAKRAAGQLAREI